LAEAKYDRRLATAAFSRELRWLTLGAEPAVVARPSEARAELIETADEA
jgi:hypothetical protein